MAKKSGRPQLKKQTIPKGSSLSRVIAQRTGGWLQARVDEHLESDIERRYDPGWFHPSALGNPCDALLAFQYMGSMGKSTTKARTQRIFDLGTSRDEDIKRYLHKSNISLMKHWGGSPTERKLASAERYIEIKSAHIRGEFDDLGFNDVTKETYIIEIKTMNTEEWQKLRAPKNDHIIQVHPYMFAKGVLQTIFIYENKDNQDWKTYVKKFDGALWHSIELRLANIVQLVESRQLPWRTPMLNDSQCAFFHMCGAFQFKEG
jgi:hypothetical protein